MTEAGWTADLVRAWQELELPPIPEILVAGERCAAEVRKQNLELAHLRRLCEERMGPAGETGETDETVETDEAVVAVEARDLLALILDLDALLRRHVDSLATLGGTITRIPHRRLGWPIPARDEAEGRLATVDEGARLICQRLRRTLLAIDCHPIAPAPGEPFDPDRHRAVERRPGGTPERIAALLDVGWARSTTIIRPAAVAVHTGASP